MKRTLLLAICTSILTVLVTQLAFARLALNRAPSAVIPEIISYQGILNDNDGNPLNGNYNLTVRIYKQESGGSALWEETHANVAVNNGLFHVLLGNVNPLTVAFDEPYYMGLSINGGDELTPRLPFTSVATAFVAKVAYTLAPDADGNITLGGNVDVEGKIGATEYCDENGENCVTTPNMGGGWIDIPLDDASDFNPSCEYRFQSVNDINTVYPDWVSPRGLTFEVSTAAWRLGRIWATDKSTSHLVYDGNNSVVALENNANVIFIQKRCAG